MQAEFKPLVPPVTILLPPFYCLAKTPDRGATGPVADSQTLVRCARFSVPPNQVSSLLKPGKRFGVKDFGNT
jgi:hypothetical protein